MGCYCNFPGGEARTAPDTLVASETLVVVRHNPRVSRTAPQLTRLDLASDFPLTTIDNMAGKRKQSKTSSSNTASKKQKKADVVKPFRLLDLPPELRADIYEKVIEDNPIAFFSRSHPKADLLSTSPLVFVNKQIREEFKGTLYMRGTLTTTVRDFDFGPLIGFLNRMDDRDVKLFEGAQENSNVLRKAVITLLVQVFCPEYPKYLARWVKRMDDLTKKGASIEFEYEIHQDSWLSRSVRKSGISLFNRDMKALGDKGRAEFQKIELALAE